MSIYEREYTQASRSGRSGAGLLDRFSATHILIGINVLCFILGLIADLKPFMREHFVVRPQGVLEDFQFHTIITHAFFHIDIWHILFNMWTLAFFGRLMEDTYGRGNTAVLYLMGGVASGLGVVVYQNALGLTNGAVGASGAIYAIAIVCACTHPDMTIGAFFFIPMKMKWAAALYIFLDIIGAGAMGSSPIAHAGHLGGALMGYIYYKLDLRVFRGEGRTGIGFLARLQNLFHRKPKLRIVERPGPAVEREPLPERSKVDSRTAERVDELLKKISDEGIGALNDEERAFLQASSQKYRR